MPIKVQCPNPVCSQVITVKDEYAGKRGKCPACGSAMMIPSGSGSRPALDLGATETTSVRSTPDELRLPTTDTGEAPIEPIVQPRGRKRSAGPGFLADYSLSDLATRLALVIGLVALVFLSVVPQLPATYVSVSSGNRTDGSQAQYLFQQLIWTSGGNTMLVYSALAAVLALLSLLYLDPKAGEGADRLLAAAGSVAGGWGVTVVFWLLGLIWKVFTIADKVNKDLKAEAKATILPGFGLVLGLFAAVAVIAVFGYLLISRRRFFWAAGAAVLGFFFGMLLLLFSARPWDASPFGEGRAFRPW